MTTTERVKIKREIRAEIEELRQKQAAAADANDRTLVALLETKISMAKAELGEMDL